MSEEDIESLKSYYEKAKEVINDQHNEIERLNNILNELEKILEEDYKNNQDTIDYPCVYLDKLKELKEGNND